MLKGLRNLVLVGFTSALVGSCSFISSLTIEEIVGSITIVSATVGIVAYDPPSELEAYAIGLYKRDFGDKEKFPKGYEKYPIGMTYQYRGDICFFLNSNDSGEVWLPIFRLAKENMEEEKYNSRKRKLKGGGIDFYRANELTKVCLEADSNSVNGNKDSVAHPEEIMARLEQVVPGATVESLKEDRKREYLQSSHSL